MSLPSSMADFVPCDRLLQKAYCACTRANHALRARANLSALMTQKWCAVGMRNAILRNHLKHTYKKNKRDWLEKISAGIC